MSDDKISFTAKEKKTIANNCFQLPKYATQIEAYVGVNMIKQEGMFERKKKEMDREKAVQRGKFTEDKSRALRIISMTVFRDEEQLQRDLSADSEHVKLIINSLLVARKIRKTKLGQRYVYSISN